MRSGKPAPGPWEEAEPAHRVQAWVDEKAWSDAKLQRLRIYGCVLCGSLIFVYFALFSLNMNNPASVEAMGGALLALALCALLVWKTQATRVASHACILTVFTGIFAFGGLSHGYYAMSLWLIPVVPLLAVFLLNLRSILVYSLIGLVPIICGYLSLSLAKSPFGVGSMGEMAPASEWLAMRIIVAVMVAILGALLGYSSSQGIRRLVRQSQRIKQQIHASESDHRAKGAFLAQMSHEIRTPVHGVLGMIAHLKSLPLNATAAPMVQSMQECAQALSRLLTAILDLAKLESGRVELQPQHVELAQFTRDLVADHVQPALDAGLEMVAVVPEQEMWVWMDATRIRQALEPLIENAIKFSKSGKIEVQLRALEGSSSDLDVCNFEITVQDEGVGLSVEQQSRIFGQFEQFHDELVKEKGGVGLGLTLVSRLVRALGGEIEVHSESGEGSQFILRLSASTQEAKAKGVQRRARTSLVRPAQRRSGKTRVISGALGQRGERLYRRRRLLLFHRVFIPAILYYSVDTALTGEYGMLATLLLALAVVVGSMLKIPEETQSDSDFRGHSWFFTIGYGVFIFAIGFFDGQVDSDSLWLISLTPIIASFLLGIRETLPALGMTFLFIALSAICEWYWHQPIGQCDSIQDALVYRLVYSVLFSSVAVSACLVSDRQTEVLKERHAEWESLKEQAMQANEAKTRFLATMSHEIRTPMNGVLGFAQDLLAQTLPEDQTRALQTIHRCGGHLLVLLNEILDSSRVESDEIAIAEIPFDVAELLNDVQRLFESRASQKGLELRCVVDKELDYKVVGDPTRMMQVIANLVGNAIKFSDRGLIEISLKGHLRGPCAGPDLDAKGAREDALAVFIAVRDQGIGMSTTQLAKAFEDFVQIDEEGDNRRGGTGLGLAISRRLATAMGGELLASSVPKQGSCFTLALTLPRDRRVEAAPVQKRTEPSLRQGARILVVDDNAVNRKVASLSLQRFGCSVETAVNGQEALDSVQATAFDLVLMDVRMPVMDGLQATRAIRALGGRFRDLPIVALTADGFEETKQSCIQSGMNDHLAKPFTSEDLQAMLAAQLGGDSTQSPFESTRAA